MTWYVIAESHRRAGYGLHIFRIASRSLHLTPDEAVWHAASYRCAYVRASLEAVDTTDTGHTRRVQALHGENGCGIIMLG